MINRICPTCKKDTSGPNYCTHCAAQLNKDEGKLEMKAFNVVKPLMFKLNNTQYEGFAIYSLARKIQPNQQLVIVGFDGEPDIWIVDGAKGLAALKSYYKEYEQFEVTFQVFSPSL